MPHRINRPAPTTSTQRDEKRDAGTRERTRRTWGRRERRTDDGTKTHGLRKTTSKQRDAGRDARRDDDDKGKSKQYEAVIGGREEQTVPFSHLSPDPLSPILSHPSASIIPPPPGVGRAGGETGSPRSPSHPLPRRAPSLTPSPHPLSLAASSHPWHHLSARAVLGSSSIHAAIVPANAGRPGETPSVAPHQGIYPMLRPTTSRTRRRTERWDGVRFPIVISIVVPRWFITPYCCPQCSPQPNCISPRKVPSRGRR